MTDQAPAALLRAAAEMSLTDNELAVLRGAADGETYAETSRRIFLTEKSVSNVATRVMRKLNAKTMAQAVHLAHQAGLLRRERHGDHAGYTAHLRRGEKPCEPCRLGERAYRNGKREAA
ncbi:response regulator transcription factor [Streptomyces asiaticus]